MYQSRPGKIAGSVTAAMIGVSTALAPTATVAGTQQTAPVKKAVQPVVSNKAAEVQVAMNTAAAQMKELRKAMLKMSANSIEAAVENLRVAMLTADNEMLDEIVSKDVSFGHSNGLIQTKGEFISNLIKKVEVFNTLELTGRDIRVVGDVALERHTFDADLVFDGKRFTVSLGVLQTWKKEDGRWKLLARQAFKA